MARKTAADLANLLFKCSDPRFTCVVLDDAFYRLLADAYLLIADAVGFLLFWYQVTFGNLNLFPGPLLDRMELIEVSGYLTEETLVCR